MFESDDFDQVLSQFEFPEDVNTARCSKEKQVPVSPELTNKLPSEGQNIIIINKDENTDKESPNRSHSSSDVQNKAIITSNITNGNKIVKDFVSPKHVKRKMIHSYFDHKSKRKFPGPAGLLNGDFEENKDETICQMELLSQDVDFTQNNLRGDLFESPLWTRLLDDLKDWNIKNVDSIKVIKEQARIAGSLRRRKANTVTAFVETVDRSVTDPLIIMRDTSGNIKGTLHRDAWSAFSQYIAAEYCAFILCKPTILTTGAAFKKHYLNITLSNIVAIYSSTVLSEDAEKTPLPDGYSIVFEEDYTVIKTQNNVQDLGMNTSSGAPESDNNELLDDLDSIFSDDIF